MSIQKQVAPILITTAMIWELTLRLLLAGILGAVIGLDREYRAKEAGFRTHFLVSLGSALFMIISQYGFAEILHNDPTIKLDPSRVAAQIVSGIGFLGAGTIIFQKQFVRGADDGCRFVGNSRNRYGNRRRIVWTGSCGNPAYVGESGASDPII